MKRNDVLTVLVAVVALVLVPAGLATRGHDGEPGDGPRSGHECGDWDNGWDGGWNARVRGSGGGPGGGHEGGWDEDDECDPDPCDTDDHGNDWDGEDGDDGSWNDRRSGGGGHGHEEEGDDECDEPTAAPTPVSTYNPTPSRILVSGNGTNGAKGCKEILPSQWGSDDYPKDEYNPAILYRMKSGGTFVSCDPPSKYAPAVFSFTGRIVDSLGNPGLGDGVIYPEAEES